jgi:putative transcriptional regulator
MIRFKLAELMADHSFREGRRLELGEVAQVTGIHRSTLSRIVNVRGANVTSGNMDLLCKFFACSLADLAEYIPDESLPAPTGAAVPAVKRSAAKKWPANRLAVKTAPKR